MVFFKAVPAVASLPALRTYKCEQCGVPVTKTVQDPPQKRAKKTRNISTVANDNGRSTA
jgi:hypothetical protein